MIDADFVMSCKPGPGRNGPQWVAKYVRMCVVGQVFAANDPEAQEKAEKILDGEFVRADSKHCGVGLLIFSELVDLPPEAKQLKTLIERNL